MTTLLPKPPSEVNDEEVGEIDVTQLLGAACVMVTVVKPIVTMPIRDPAPVLGATLNPTVPGPEPLVPDVIEIQGTLLTAPHPQPAPVVTALLPAPPSPPKVWLAGVTL